ncbi:MAG: hypothetical protein C5B49_04295, partial [Bdellovibrio sp.]
MKNSARLGIFLVWLGVGLSAQAGTKFQYSGQLFASGGASFGNQSINVQYAIYDGGSCYLFGGTQTLSTDTDGFFSLTAQDSATEQCYTGVATGCDLQMALQSAANVTCVSSSNQLVGGTVAPARYFRLWINSDLVDEQPMYALFESVNAQRLGGYAPSSANSAMAPVQRDAAGGFAAGLITAAGLTTTGTVSASRLIGSLDASQLVGTIPAALMTSLSNLTTGTLAAAQGGTGLVPSSGAANKLYGVNSSGSGTEFKSLIAGGGITIDNSVPGQISISSAQSGGGGTVTSITAGTGL